MKKRNSYDIFKQLKILAILKEIKGAPNIVASVNENINDLIIRNI